jgi:hypothetical protein
LFLTCFTADKAAVVGAAVEDRAVGELKEDSAADELKEDNAADELKEDSAVDELKEDSAVDELKEDSAVEDSVGRAEVGGSVVGEASGPTFRISPLSLPIVFLPTSWIISASTNTRSMQRTTKENKSTAEGDEWTFLNKGYGKVYSSTCPRKKKTT